MFSLIRLAIILFTRRWGLIVIGAICIIGGLVFGVLSHNVTYQRTGPAHIAHYLADTSSNDGYLQLDNGSTLYIVHQGDFSPSIDGINTFKDGDTLSIVYRTDDTTSIDASSTIGTHLNGEAYNVVQIADSDTNSVYTTDTYNQNPTGYYQNNWGGGIALFLLGAIIAALAFFLPTIRAKRGKGVATNMTAATYMGYPNQPNYPGYNQNPQYPMQPMQPVQPVQSAQPSNPYGNPYGVPAQYPPVPQPQYPPYPQNQPYPQPSQYPPYQPGQPVQQPQNTYSQHGQSNNPYPPYQQPQE